MKQMILRMSRRERLYLLLGLAVLGYGVVVYPVNKKAKAYHEETLEQLQADLELLKDLYGLQGDEPAIKAEHEKLLAALRSSDDLLFPPIENRILTQTAMTKLLNQLGPDLELEINPGKSSVRDGANQMNLSIKGEGRYPEILKFLHRLETYRPLMLVDSFSVTAKKSKDRDRRREVFELNQSRGGSRTPAPQSSSEPTLSLRMSIQINCQDGGEE